LHQKYGRWYHHENYDHDDDVKLERIFVSSRRSSRRSIHFLFVCDVADDDARAD